MPINQVDPTVAGGQGAVDIDDDSDDIDSDIDAEDSETEKLINKMIAEAERDK
jgi:hypothetical protein